MRRGGELPDSFMPHTSYPVAVSVEAIKRLNAAEKTKNGSVVNFVEREQLQGRFLARLRQGTTLAPCSI
jgi:hypothetical protein